jgi:hypothetical protein
MLSAKAEHNEVKHQLAVENANLDNLKREAMIYKGKAENANDVANHNELVKEHLDKSESLRVELEG